MIHTAHVKRVRFICLIYECFIIHAESNKCVDMDSSTYWWIYISFSSLSLSLPLSPYRLLSLVRIVFSPHIHFHLEICAKFIVTSIWNSRMLEGKYQINDFHGISASIWSVFNHRYLDPFQNCFIFFIQEYWL